MSWNEDYREGDEVEVDFNGWKPATVAQSSVQSDLGPCVSVLFKNEEDAAHVTYTFQDAEGNSVVKVGRHHVWHEEQIRKS